MKPNINRLGANPVKKIAFDEALKHTSPHSVSLISSLTPDGITNLAAVCWWTFLESEPPMLGFSMANESYTCELIKNTKKAVLSIPGETIAEEAFKCGTASGRDVNKAQEYNIALVDAPLKYPLNSKVAFICTVVNLVPVGDCTFFICDIDEIHYNENEKHVYATASGKLETVS
jgi:flavin reductase (DIM6/NTAB) family NADH-FMN oxidoreductase RutF